MPFQVNERTQCLQVTKEMGLINRCEGRKYGTNSERLSNWLQCRSGQDFTFVDGPPRVALLKPAEVEGEGEEEAELSKVQRVQAVWGAPDEIVPVPVEQHECDWRGRCYSDYNEDPEDEEERVEETHTYVSCFCEFCHAAGVRGL